MTNGDFIRNCNNDELAKLIAGFISRYCEIMLEEKHPVTKESKAILLQWLEKECEENEAEIPD